LGALLMRGIGCTVNDMCDRDIDKHVERTRFRPLTSGQLSMRNAVWFLLGQLLVCGSLLFFLNEMSRWLAVAGLPFVCIYPLWQVGYDSIYAYVDVRDDARLGLRSTAMRFGAHGKLWIGGFYAATIALWAWGGHAMGLGWGYQAGMVAVAAHLAWQLYTFDLQRPDRNFMLFRANLWTGVLLIAAA